MRRSGDNANGKHQRWAVASLLFGAALWGIIWYPYRKLEQEGVGGALATLATYAVALVLASMLRPSAWRELRDQPLLLLAIAVTAGWSIVSYVVAVLHAEVVRVLLLFYLAPLWTLPLARIFLKESPSSAGYAVLALALLGAAIMLWQPESGMPLPRSAGEWLGLSSGFAFACSNILVRKSQVSSIVAKSLAVWLGTAVMAALVFTIEPNQWRQVPHLLAAHWPLIAGVGVAVLTMSLCIQYGLTNLPANQAIVVMLFELVVAAIAAYILAGETLTQRDWIGGVMIVAAGLFSNRLAPKADGLTTSAAASQSLTILNRVDEHGR